MYQTLLGLILSALVAVISCSAEHKNFLGRFDASTLRPETIPAQNVVISDKDKLKAFWAEYGSAVPPKLDFSKYVILGIFLGERPNPGFGVKISDIIERSDTIEVRFTEYLPNPDMGYVQVIVYPFDMVYIPKTMKRIVFSGFKKVRN